MLDSVRKHMLAARTRTYNRHMARSSPTPVPRQPRKLPRRKELLGAVVSFKYYCMDVDMNVRSSVRRSSYVRTQAAARSHHGFCACTVASGSPRHL